MPNTNFQTIFQMPGIVNDIVKQATGRESVSQIGMDFVTVGQNQKTAYHEGEYTDISSFVNNNDLPLNILVKITGYQEGTGDPSPSNVRDLVGFDKCNIYRTGFNIFNKATVTPDKYIASTGILNSNSDWNVSDYIPVKEEAQYYIKGTLGSNPGFCWFDSTKTYISGVSGNQVNTAHRIITAPAGAMYLRASLKATDIDTFCVNVSGDNNGEYAPYKSDKYAVSFPTPPGSIYMGVLDVAVGKLTVNKELVDLGNLTWTYSDSKFIAAVTGIKPYASETSYAEVLCENYKSIGANASSASVADLTVSVLAASSPGNQIFIADSNYESAETFTTAMDGVLLAYELATPAVYTLDPVTVKSLIGENFVFADTGDVAVSYTSYIPVI